MRVVYAWLVRFQVMISYLDTNVAIFLHAGNAARLTQRATEQMESADLLVSAMVMLELEMLYEKGTIKYTASQILSGLNNEAPLITTDRRIAKEYLNAIW